jgi:pyruvate dehydrogenase E1 component
VWSALARRFAGSRFDRGPAGRIICVLEYPELRDAAVWEAVTDERTPYLGELFWVVLVSGAAVGAEADGQPRAGLGGSGGPDRAARLFEAAGWQVLTLRFGRRLQSLFQRPGGQALRARLGRMGQEEYRELLAIRDAELRRRLAGPGAAGVGIAGLVERMTDDEIHAALRDLGGHDLALLIDAFDEVATDRPTVLFAHTHDVWTRDADAHEVAHHPRPATAPLVGITSIRPMGAGGADLVSSVSRALAPAGGGTTAPSTLGTRGARLATHVASYLDRAAPAAPALPEVPPDADLTAATTAADAAVVSSTQAAFGTLLRGLAGLAPEVLGCLVTVSTRDADAVVAGWLDPGGAMADDGAGGSGPDASGGALVAATGRRHVAGALAPGAFAGVLGNLGVAWNRHGVGLLPLGVTDELAAGRIVPAWAAGCAADARSVLAVADTGVGGLAAPGTADGAALPGVVRYEPAFTQDLAWCLLAALGRLGRADGSASLLRLSARLLDQRPAAVAGVERARRHAAVLAGGYRLRTGGPAPVVTLVGMGTVMPEVLAAADELEARLGDGVGVVVVTSADLVFAALRSRDAHATGAEGMVPESGEDPHDQGGAWVLGEMFPEHLRSPMLTVLDGDSRGLGFLAGVHGDRLGPLGPAADGALVPVETQAIVDAALALLAG